MTSLSERLDTYAAASGAAWDTYTGAVSQTREAWREKSRALNFALLNPPYHASDLQQRERDEAYQAYDAASEAAWGVLNETMDAAFAAIDDGTDSLVGWIVDNCHGFQDEAVDLMGQLPAPLVDLDEYAYSREWCEVWDEFRDRAIAAGVISYGRVNA